MKTIILARVSTEEQMTKGQSIPAQLRRIKDYCLRKNLKIIKEFSFDESAYKTSRNEFDKALDYINKQKGKIAVCFDKVDRFSRNVFDTRVSALYDLAMQDKLELHFVSDNQVIHSGISASEKFQYSTTLGLAKYYSDAVSDNVVRTFELKVRNGQWPRVAPIGYLNTADSKGGRTIVPDPERGHYITRAFTLYATGQYSFKTLAHKLKKEGFRGTRAPYKPIEHNKLHAIIKNPFYYGDMVVKGKIWPHYYEKLVSKKLFDKCQKVRLSWNKKTTKYASIPFIFRGLIKCAYCGCTITAERKKNKYNYYRCTKYKGECGAERMKEEDLVVQVEKLLKNLKMPDNVYQDQLKSLEKSHNDKAEYYQNTVGGLKKQHKRLEKNLEVMYQDRLDGRITTEEYDNKLKTVKDKQKDILLQIENHDEADEKYYLTANRLLELSQKAYQVFKSSKPRQKNRILSFMLLNCKLKGQKLTFNLKEPFNYLYMCSKSHSWRVDRMNF